MAGEIPDLVALERTGTGKGAARQVRRDGMVPGIVFGGDAEPLAIQLPFNELLKRLKEVPEEYQDKMKIIYEGFFCFSFMSCGVGIRGAPPRRRSLLSFPPSFWNPSSEQIC